MSDPLIQRLPSTETLYSTGQTTHAADSPEELSFELVIEENSAAALSGSHVHNDTAPANTEPLFIEPRVPVNCCICNAKLAIYKCPGCSRQTCSATCVKQHKLNFDCDGTRPKSSFVPLASMSDDTLAQDFKLLEDARQTAKEARRDPTIGLSTSSGSSSLPAAPQLPTSLPQRISVLRKAALERNTHVLFLPHGFKRSKENSTFVNARRKQIMWRVEWVFGFLQGSPRHSSSLLISENTALQSMVEAVESGKGVSDEILRNKVTAALEKLGIHARGGAAESGGSHQHLAVLFKAEGLPANTPKYHRFTNWGQSLKECLSGLTFIEFPTLHLVPVSALERYVLVESKEELGKLVASPTSSLLELEMKDKRLASKLRNGARRSDKTRQQRPAAPLVEILSESGPQEGGDSNEAEPAVDAAASRSANPTGSEEPGAPRASVSAQQPAARWLAIDYESSDED